MKVLKFTLSGKQAFFKKPEVNSYFYFTYGTIHKVALLGMFGSILGYKGYGSIGQDKKGNLIFGEKEKLPEFYIRLQGLQVAVEPLAKKGDIPKKIQVFNNSVGYASKEQGGNLIVKEQWLENPKWNIYVLLEGEESKKLAKALEEKNCIYCPYLGKNDHFADITQIQVLEVKEGMGKGRISSMFLKDKAGFPIIEEDDWDEMEWFKYQETLPVGLTERTNMYQKETFVYTNLSLDSYQGTVYQVEGKQIAFY